MGCEGSKPGGAGSPGRFGPQSQTQSAAEAQRLRGENERLRLEMQKMRGRGQPRSVGRAPDSPRSLQLNGGSIRFQPPKLKKNRWRDQRMAAGHRSGAAAPSCQMEALAAPPTGSLADAVKEALAAVMRGDAEAAGYTVDREGFHPPGSAPRDAKPLDAAAVLAAAASISDTHTAVAAQTLVSPLGLEVPEALADPSNPAHPATLAFNAHVQSELLTLPAFTGLCFKGWPDRVSGSYTPGHVVAWHRFMPATLSPSVAARSLALQGDDLCGTLLVIQSLNGRDVSCHSAAVAEQEVLFPANVQFRTSDKISSAVKTLLRNELGVALRDVSVVALCEVRLVVWRDVLCAMDEVETASCPQAVALLEQATADAEASGIYVRDVVGGGYILGAPMTLLPPRDVGGMTVVHLVAAHAETLGLLRMVTHHLTPQQVNEVNADGRSALHLALAHNNAPGAAHLLGCGASAATLGTVADGALAAAITQASGLGWGPARIEELLAQVPQQDLETVVTSKVVLRAAAGLGRLAEAQQLLRLLMRHLEDRIDPRVRRTHHLKYLDTSGMVAAACAAPEVEPELLSFLVSEINAKDTGAAVLAAVEAGNLHILPHLVRLGIPLDGAVRDRRTAMHAAAAKGDVQALLSLREAGARMDVCDNFGWTLAHEAAHAGRAEVLQRLLEWGCTADAADVDGCTPLWWAADVGNDALVEALRRAGADVNCCDATGTPPISIAAYNGRAETVKLLLALGAKPEVANKQGRTPLWLAAGSGSLPSLEVLRAAGADPSATDAEGMTPVHIAAQEGWAEVLDRLSSWGADLGAQDKSGRTPLHFAAAKGRFSCVELLVSSGVDVSRVAEDPVLGAGCLPLHVASAKKAFEVRIDLYAALLDDTVVNKQCASGSPLDIALRNDRHALANMLREHGGECTDPELPDELMAEIPTCIVSEVVYRHPLTLPEKNSPGALVRIFKCPDADKFTYTLNGEERPSFKVLQLYKGTHGLALKFPDAQPNGRQVYLPVTGVREILGGLLYLADSCGIPNDIRADFAALCAQGNMPPVRKVRAERPSEEPKARDGEPCFTSVVFASDVAPHMSSVVRVVTEYAGGEEGASTYQWQRANPDGEWADVRRPASQPDETGTSASLYITADELGCKLRVVCTPVRADGVRGRPVESAVLTVMWPPHLGVTLVAKLTEAHSETCVSCDIGSAHYQRAYLQLKEDRLKIKSIDNKSLESLVSAPFSRRLRCVPDGTDSRLFEITGLAESVKVSAETRLDRDFIVAMIRVWAACCDEDVCIEALGMQFHAAWTSEPHQIDEATRADMIWGALQEKSGLGLLQLQRHVPGDASEEARQATVVLRRGFATGLIRRPPTRAALRRDSLGPSSPSPDPRRLASPGAALFTHSPNRY